MGRTLYTDVSFVRGLGDSGRKLQLVDEECEYCSHEKTLRYTSVSPELSDETEDSCLLPNCPNYHDDQWSWMFR